MDVFRRMVPVCDSVPTELSESLSTVASGATDRGRARPTPFTVGNPGLPSTPTVARGSTALYGRSLGLPERAEQTLEGIFLMALRGGGAGGIRRGLPFTPPPLPTLGWISVM